ncbi:minor tail protein [Mycobacterium phage Bipolar]|uniref:minor tail protein n=1 Tax=Mycobacterium phage Bipolar TaxID=1551711 RepID=UPI00051A8EDA|nr:minor tail protein [Mycobacterium phage Bipolar]AIT13058.1 minor tail protein [Mycobacterium phage Bipolar]
MPGWIVETITTPTPAVVGVTGGTPTVIATEHKLVEPTAAELVITGGQPLSGPVITPGAAEVTITGGTPVVSQARLLTPGALNLTITGGQPSVVKNTIITPTKASLTLTGGQPTITNQSPAAYDTSVNGNGGVAVISNFTITAATGADIFVPIAWDRSGATISSVTCGGVAMTQIAQVDHNNTSGYGGLRLYRLAGAGNGTAKTISITSSGNVYIGASAISFTGVPTTLSPVTAYGSGTSASQTVTVPGNVGLYVASAGGAGAPTYTYTSYTGVTNRTNLNANGAQLTQSTVAASGTVSAISGGPNAWASVFVPF